LLLSAETNFGVVLLEWFAVVEAALGSFRHVNVPVLMAFRTFTLPPFSGSKWVECLSVRVCVCFGVSEDARQETRLPLPTDTGKKA
jgi:hypothetical protein